jgi:hypothetical protein
MQTICLLLVKFYPNEANKFIDVQKYFYGLAKLIHGFNESAKASKVTESPALPLLSLNIASNITDVLERADRELVN